MAVLDLVKDRRIKYISSTCLLGFGYLSNAQRHSFFDHMTDGSPTPRLEGTLRSYDTVNKSENVTWASCYKVDYILLLISKIPNLSMMVDLYNVKLYHP